jgi:ferredoxin--NADP+ reductase
MSTSPATPAADYQLAIIGANRAGISLAMDAYAAGVERIVIIDGHQVALPDLGGQPDVRFGTPVEQIREDGTVTVSGTGFELTADVAVVAGRVDKTSIPPDYDIPGTLTNRVFFEMPRSVPVVDDVLVIGTGETAAEYAEELVDSGHRSVVLALPSIAFDQLACQTREDLLRIEAERKATIFWHSHPTAVVDAGGYPMVTFSDRRTPDLVFDRIIYSLGTGERSRHLDRLGITLEAVSEPPAVYVLTEEDPGPDEPESPEMIFVSPGHAWGIIHDRHFPDLAKPHDLEARPPLVFSGLAERLRDKHYNATITSFMNHHSDLWILRVKPDVGDARHEPGQYVTLALGYWEPRLDGSDEHLDESKIEKLVRRSYSISFPMLDEDDKLVAPEDIDGLEFYIVLVRPEGMDHLPELTPRLALKRAGDRIFMGPKVAGRYTLKPVTDPNRDVVFLSTGTGEAPHNNMTAQLLRNGHTGRIVSACTVRYQRDLAYLETHRRLEKLYPNYSYFALTTREADTINNKVYIQDMITNGMLAEVLGHEPSPDTTEFFLCGNPLMIGLPEEWGDGEPEWPKPRGVSEILTGLGFTVDHRGVEGNVHYEEYW